MYIGVNKYNLKYIIHTLIEYLVIIFFEKL